MKKEEYIRKYGETAYATMLQQKRDWRGRNPDNEKTNHREANRKGGKHYAHQLKYKTTGGEITLLTEEEIRRK